MMKLSSSAAKLLGILVSGVEAGRFDPSEPRTFMAYGEALDLMDLPDNAPRGLTDGETLQQNGMQDLALWLFRHQDKLPAITSLIVSKHQTGDRPPYSPGKGFFRAYERRVEDWTWWLEETKKAVKFDWKPYLTEASPEGLKPNLDPLTRSLIEKAGYSNGWENVLPDGPDEVAMASARHKAEARVRRSSSSKEEFAVSFPKGPPIDEIVLGSAEWVAHAGWFEIIGLGPLGKVLRRAAELAMSLPNHAVDIFREEAAKIEDAPPAATETIRLAKQRIGQDIFRKALIEYWGGACAVTGLELPAVLRASHAKPWASCETDAERLDVFNGFLLSANLDALFDRGYITFDDGGRLTKSPELDANHISLLHLAADLAPKLRWVSPSHLPYLAWHRSEVFLK